MLGGFKNFLLRGNLVDLAVAVIIGTAFGKVVASFTAWLTAQIPATSETFKGAKEGSGAFFANDVISFVILAVLALSGYFAVRSFFGVNPPAGVPPGPEGAVIIEGEYEVEREDGSRAAGRVIEGVIEVRPPEAGGNDNNRPK